MYFEGNGLHQSHVEFVLSEIAAAHNKSYSDGRADSAAAGAREATAALRACNEAIQGLARGKR